MARRRTQETSGRRGTGRPVRLVLVAQLLAGLLLAGLLLAGLVLAGCSAGDDAPARGSAPEPSAASPAGGQATGGRATGGRAAGGRAAGVRYVALGDSYSAGPLIPVQRLDPLGCGRSTNNYPAYLAGYLQVASYRDVTCSGARSADVTGSQQVAFGGVVVPPQAAALDADTDLVTVGLGGNDDGLFGRLVGTCTRVAGDRTGAPCRRHFTSAAGTTLATDARRLRSGLADALAAVRRAAPGARVYAVGYPQILPASGTCAAIPFARGDYRWARSIERLLNRSVQQAAATTGSTYVDLWGASRGHDACAGPAAWIRGSQDVADAAPFHPFRSGEQAFARVVFAAVTGRQAPDPSPAEAAPPSAAVVINGS